MIVKRQSGNRINITYEGQRDVGDTEKATYHLCSIPIKNTESQSEREETGGTSVPQNKGQTIKKGRELYI